LPSNAKGPGPSPGPLGVSQGPFGVYGEVGHVIFAVVEGALGHVIRFASQGGTFQMGGGMADCNYVQILSHQMMIDIN
jgi:hypothetical protein